MTEKCKKSYYWYKNIFLVAKNKSIWTIWTKRMIEKTDIITKHLKNLMILMYLQSILVDSKNFLNNRKTRIIPPLLCENRLHRKNYLNSTNQPGFKTGDSSSSHLLSITHGINELFDKGTTFKVCFFTYQRRLIRFAMKV